jgi:ATP-dependent DNA ligase
MIARIDVSLVGPVCALPLAPRKQRLRRLRRRANPFIIEAMAIDGREQELMATVTAHDLEGIVAKRKRDPYRRGATW